MTLTLLVAASLVGSVAAVVDVVTDGRRVDAAMVDALELLEATLALLLRFAQLVVVLVAAVAAVIDLVAEAPARDALEVVAAEAKVLRTVDLLTHLRRLVRRVAAVVVTVAAPVRRDTHLHVITDILMCKNNIEELRFTPKYHLLSSHAT